MNVTTPPVRERSPEPANPYAKRYIIAWALALVFYFLEYAARSSPAVMIPELSAAFGVTVVGVSAIIGTYYYTYSVTNLVAWSRTPRVAVVRCCKIRPNSRCAGSDDYAGYMLARHIKPKKIVFHSRLLPHETCRMNRVQHLKTKKGFLVFSDGGFMTYQSQT